MKRLKCLGKTLLSAVTALAMAGSMLPAQAFAAAEASTYALSGAYNVAKGKSYYVHQAEPSNSYPDSTGHELTDGVKGNTNASNSAWSGYYQTSSPTGKPVDRWPLKSVVIDLGGTKSINSIKGTFLTSSSAGAGQPTMVCTFASMDGTNWMPMSRTSIIDQWSSGIHTYGWHVSNTNGLYTDLSWDDNSVYRAKYVRFDFQTRGLNLIDEIEVTGVDGEAAGSLPPGNLTTLDNSTNYQKPGTATAGIQDMVLCYNGYYDGNTGDWNAEQFKPLLAYYDKYGRAQDKMFDAVLLLALRSPYGCDFAAPADSSQYAQGRDWNWVMDKTFKTNGDLAALNEAARQTSIALGDPNYKVKFVMSIPYPDQRYTSFGPLSGNYYNLSTDSGYQSAVNWFINQTESRFNSGSYQYVDLVGYYWLDEAVNRVDRIRYTASRVQNKGYKFFWIPYYTVPGALYGKDLQFDAVAYQPNHFFPDAYNENDIGLIGTKQVVNAAKLAAYANIGLELEIDDRLLTNVDKYNQGLDYFNASVEQGFRGPGVFRCWYNDVRAYYKCAISPNSKARAIYDYAYQVMRGTYTKKPYIDTYDEVPDPNNILSGIAYTTGMKVGDPNQGAGNYVNDPNRTKLTDNRRAVLCEDGTAGYFNRNYNSLTSADFTFDLGGRKSFQQVNISTLAGANGIGRPSKVTIQISNDTGTPSNWTTICSTAMGGPETNKEFIYRTQNGKRITARHIRLLLDFGAANWMAIDDVKVLSIADSAPADGNLNLAQSGEFDIDNAANLALNRPYTVSAPPAERYYDARFKALTDGLVGDATIYDWRWVGFNAARDIVVDLGAVKPFQGVQAVLLNAVAEGGVTYPGALNFSYSSDGKNWTSFVNGSVPASAPENAVYTYSYAKTSEVQGRYVKLSVPAGFTFISELRVLAKTDALPSEPAPTLLSKGRPYTVSVPAGAAGSWSDPDDGVKLTDGVTVADPRYFNADRNLYTGRSNGSGVDVPVSTVIDLGAQKAIHQVSATFVVNSDYALYLPTSFKVDLSNDGSNWVSVHNEYIGGTPAIPVSKFFSARFAPQIPWKARYVRVTYTQNAGIVLTDEIEVWGNSDLSGCQDPADVGKPVITGFTAPSITVEDNDFLTTSARAALRMPKQVQLSYDGGTVTANVINWVCVDYDPQKLTPQTFTAFYETPAGYRQPTDSVVSVTGTLTLKTAQTENPDLPAQQNLIRGKAYTTNWANSSYHGGYPDTNRKKLTDGVRADGIWNGNNVGFNKNGDSPVILTFDLGKKQELTEFSVCGWDSNGSGVRNPSHIAVEYLNEQTGVWTKAIDQEVGRASPEGNDLSYKLSFAVPEGTTVTAQKVRFILTHDPYSGTMFLDEVEIFGRNVTAAATPLTGFSEIPAVTVYRDEGLTTASKAAQKLPSTVALTYQGGTVNVPVNWNCTNFDPSSTASQTFTASYETPVGYRQPTNGNVAVTATLTLKHTQSDALTRNLAAGISYSTNWANENYHGSGQDVNRTKLTDNQFAGSPWDAQNIVGFNKNGTAPVTLTFDLGAKKDVEAVSVLGWDGNASGIRNPSHIKVEYYDETIGGWATASDKDFGRASPEGYEIPYQLDANVNFSSRRVRITLTHDVSSGTMFLDEVRIIGTESVSDDGNVLSGRTYTTNWADANYHGSAPDSSRTKLTDGQRATGTWDWNRVAGFNKNGSEPVTLTFDLGSTKRLSKVGFSGWDNNASGVRNPSHWKVEYQNAAGNWLTLCDADLGRASVSGEEVPFQFDYLVPSGEAVVAQKLRLTLTHDASSGTMFLDEVEAWGSEVVVPENDLIKGLSYTTNWTDEQFHGMANDPSRTKLTDGELAQNSWDTARIAGFNRQGDSVAQITFNLGSLQSFQQVTISGWDNNADGIRNPSHFKVEYRDGTGNWHTTYDSDEGRASPEGNIVPFTLCYTVPGGQSLLADAVRISLTPDTSSGTMFLDEIQVLREAVSL